MPETPRATICIPHWQVRSLVALCLHAIRRHTVPDDAEILVVDNGSRDDSLPYLRSLPWIRVIERPEESFRNWPANVFTAWDRGVQEARTEFFVTLHTDVLIRQDGWLPRLISEFEGQPRLAGVGAWKLDLEPAWYTWQKQTLGWLAARTKNLLGRRDRTRWVGGMYPRDYCAVYRTDVIRTNKLTFCPGDDAVTGGYAIARQLWANGFETRLIPTREMSQLLVHVAHGTAALAAEKPLRHQAAQRKTERRVTQLFAQPWVRNLMAEVEQSLTAAGVSNRSSETS